jgi:LPS sulfotransferase NodH
MAAPCAPKAAYLICTTPRSGSWLLADALDQTGLAGHPQEYFMNHAAFDASWGVPTRANLGAYLDYVRDASTTDNGVCGIKLHWSQLRFLAGLVGSSIDDTDAAFAWLMHELSPLQVIRLDRNDKIRQAISFHRAMSDQQWWRLVGADHVQSEFDGPDLAEVDRLHRLLIRHSRRWGEQLAAAQVPVRELSYEQLAADLQGCVLDCLLRLGIAFEVAVDAVATVEPRLVRQADERTDLWVHEYITWRRSTRRPV